MTRTRVDLAELERVEAAVSASVGRIEAQLADLRTGLAPLRACWTGAAAAAWEAEQQRWDAAAADLTAGLAQLRRVLGHARHSYATAIGANVATWRR